MKILIEPPVLRKGIKIKYIIRILAVVCFVFIVILFFFIIKDKDVVYKRKQVILISIDALRADHLPSYGYRRNTSPYLSELIKESNCYTNAYANGCWTMPSHMTLLTGTLPSRHGINIDWKTYYVDKMYPTLNDSVKSIAEILKNDKFNTIKIARLPDELGFARGFNKNFNFDPFQIKDRFNVLIRELEKNKNKNFFLFIHTWMVHAPYSNSHFLRKEIKDKLGEKKLNFIDNFRNMGLDFFEFKKYLKEDNLYNIKDCVDLYDGGIYYVDKYIKKIVDKCKQLGIYKDLMFVVVSNHGEHFGERDPERFYDQHGWDYYDEFIKVPFIIKFPKQLKPKIISSPVSLIDFVPTVLDYYKLGIPYYIQGESLLNRSSKRYIISEATSIDINVEKKMIKIGDLKYIVTMHDPLKPGRVNWNSVKERKLFNLKVDPFEKDNLFKYMKHKKICFNFEKVLLRVIKGSSRMNVYRGKTRIKEKTKKFLESLGYL